MAIYIGDTIVKKVYIGDTEIIAGNVHVGGTGVHLYSYTVNFGTSNLSNVSLNSTNAITVTGYVGETFTYTRTISANDNYITPVFDSTPADTAAVDYSTSGTTLTIEITIPQGGGSETVSPDASASPASNTLTVTITGATTNCSRNVNSLSISSNSSGSFTVSPDTDFQLSAANSDATESSVYISSIDETVNSNGTITYTVNAATFTGDQTATVNNVSTATAIQYSGNISYAVASNVINNITPTSYTNQTVGTTFSIGGTYSAPAHYEFTDGTTSKNATGTTAAVPSGGGDYQGASFASDTLQKKTYTGNILVTAPSNTTVSAISITDSSEGSGAAYSGNNAQVIEFTYTLTADTDFYFSDGTTSKTGLSGSVTIGSGGDLTYSSTETAPLEIYEFHDWNGACTATTGGTVTCTAGNSGGATADDIPAAATLQDNCSSSTIAVTGQEVTVTVPSGRYSANSTVSGNATITQTNWSAATNAGPSASDVSTVAAGGGTPSATGYSFAAIGARAKRDNNCSSQTVTGNWTYTVSGNFCNSTVTGTVNVTQSSWPTATASAPSGTVGAAGGTPSYPSGYSGGSVSARGFNSGCSTAIVTGVSWSYAVSGDFCNSTVTGTNASVSQSAWPAVNVGNPTQSGTIANTGGKASFTNNKYSQDTAVSSRSFNDGCSNKTHTGVAWTYTETSGNYCNDTDSGTVNVLQAPFPALPFGTATQSGTIANTGGKASFTSSEYTQDTATDASTSSDGCSTYSQNVAVTRTVTSGSYCTNTASNSSVSVNQLPLSEFTVSGTLQNGTNGDTITASNWSLTPNTGTYVSTSPSTYQNGSNTYTVTVTPPSGFCNTANVTDTDTATGSPAVVLCFCVSSVAHSKLYTRCNGTTQFISSGPVTDGLCLQDGDASVTYSSDACTKAANCIA